MPTAATGSRRVHCTSRRRQCRQDRGGIVAAVRLPVSVSKGYRATAAAVRPFRLNRRRLGGDSQRVRRCRQRRTGLRRRQRRQDRGATVAGVRLPVSASKGNGANGGGCASNRERLQGDRRLGNRCRHHRHTSRRRRCRQNRGAIVAAVRLPVSASKGYRATVAAGLVGFKC